MLVVVVVPRSPPRSFASASVLLVIGAIGGWLAIATRGVVRTGSGVVEDTTWMAMAFDVTPQLSYVLVEGLFSFPL